MMSGSPTCLRTMWCGRRMSSATRNLQRSLTLVSSAHRPRIVRTSSAHRPPVTHETSVPRLFQVKQQRTALLTNQWSPCKYVALFCFFLYNYL